MFCYKCGAEIPDESEFCMKCGQKINISIQENTNAYPPILEGEYKLKKEYIRVFSDHIEIKRNFINTVIPFESIAAISCIKDCTVFRATVTYFKNSVTTNYHFFGFKKEKIFFELSEMLRKIAIANNYHLPTNSYNPVSMQISFIHFLQ